ncbi:hemerythrin domain-containing protein [Aurantimonas sp. VKM B-3413]|uniref:hemerythrin domain-containing protein n=1 Tax=Aurantimonas sp. VKM B-3413 TaxID=2779401 RepID=UPI001E35B783|nr:hemerythrin domain-containing protein [Aurantimonas sp. VKM B-3413]MCB8837490.1 hemerythrin domain-containing protein [Aurantimonas sp. VKM B-3413]
MEQHFDLDTRGGLPADLKALLEKYPREQWSGHANLGQTAQFWLGRHDMFRDLGSALADALSQHREGKVELDPFRRWFAPRLGFFLRELEGHHQIEDHHYFPVFQQAEAKLARGFELLESDHEVIHQDLLAVAETANRFLAMEAAGEASPSSEARRAADAYAAASEQLLRRLIRHLADEEDLIIPLILDRGEAAIGI